MNRLIIFIGVLFFCQNANAQTAPDFTVHDLAGTEYQLYADYLNQGKTVVIEFFFTTCPPCNAIAPYVSPLYQSWGSGAGDVEFFSMTILDTDTNQKVADYQEAHGHTFPGIGADGGALEVDQPYLDGNFGPFEGTPTFVVIEPNGTLHFDVSGIGYQGTINALDDAIAATGARRPYTIDVYAETPEGDTIGSYDVLLDSIAIGRVEVDTTGHFETTLFLHEDSTYVLSLQKDTLYKNGLSTFDLIKMSKQVLAVDTLDTPYKLIAADVNHSSGISTFDIIKTQKLVLSIDSSLTNNTSWVFVRKDYDFVNPENPFAEFYEGNPQKYTFAPSSIPIFKFTLKSAIFCQNFLTTKSLAIKCLFRVDSHLYIKNTNRCQSTYY